MRYGTKNLGNKDGLLTSACSPSLCSKGCRIVPKGVIAVSGDLFCSLLHSKILGNIMKNQNKFWEINKLICGDNLEEVSKLPKENFTTISIRKHFYNSLIAFFGGVCGISVLFVILFFPAPFISALFPVAFAGIFLCALFNGLIEEGTKFLLIKKWEIGKYPFGFLLGFSWAGTEIFLRYFSQKLHLLNFINVGMVVFLQIITAGIICYFVKKNKPLLGLFIAIALHTGFNIFVKWVVA